MAGDWIKMRVNLWTHPKVVTLASRLTVTRAQVIGALHGAWGVADQHADHGGIITMHPDSLDAIVETPGFCAALASVGWLVIDGDKLQFPNYQEHNGVTAKARVLTAQRTKKSRARNGPPLHDRYNGVTVHRYQRREEKIREETKDTLPNGSGGDTPPGPKDGQESQEPARQGKPTRRPSGPHQEAIDYFCGAWKALYGDAYAFNGGKDGDAVKWCLAQLEGSLERWHRVVEGFLADRSPFVVDARHTLGVLRSQFARWKVDPLASVSRPRATGPPVRRVKDGLRQMRQAAGDTCTATNTTNGQTGTGQPSG
jgi:hypothetical protein